MITLAIVEDHAIVAQGIESLLEDEPDITLVGTATDTSSALALLNEKHPDVVLCDIVLAGDEDGLALLSVAPKKGGPAFIMFSAFARPAYHARAIELGASGFVPKVISIEDLTRAIRQVAAGGTVFPPSVLRSARTARRRPSPRQREVISLVAVGHRNDDIAQQLSVEVKTVEGQLRRLFDRYGVKSRTELVRVAVSEGWIQTPGE